jgi:uncharacterized protein (DUF1499 family)
MWNRSTAALTASLLLAACASAPQLRSTTTGQLAPCASGCVSSQENRGEFHVDPMRYSGSALAAREKLVRVLKRMASMGYTVEVSEGDYVHATYQGGMKGVEDLEFVFSQSEPGVIHVRAAGRGSTLSFGSDASTHLEAVRTAYYVAKS